VQHTDRNITKDGNATLKVIMLGIGYLPLGLQGRTGQSAGGRTGS
jgi:hypothetical protein